MPNALAAALAAGSRAMIKLPEDTPRANEVIRTMIKEAFDDSTVAVFD
jgi:coniferyl-aldehyde dehydrogenase